MADKKISQLTAASTPLAGTEVLPIVQSGSTVKVASDDLTVKNVRSNATTGILQVAGPGAGTTRVMTTPNANFTAARTDASQTFTGVQSFTNGVALNATSTMNLSGITGNISLSVPYPNASNAGSLLTFTGTGDFRQTVKLRLNKDQADNAPVDVMQWGPGVDVTVSAGNLVVGTAAKGIDFSANTGAAGETSSLLNWYEEGTFTPSDVSGAALTFTNQSGYYTRIGRVVTCHVQFQYPSTADGSQARISLPFTAKNDNNCGGGVFYVNTPGTGISNCQPNVTANQAYFVLSNVTGGVAYTNANATGNYFRGTITYIV